jgi:hypothetical protein
MPTGWRNCWSLSLEEKARLTVGFSGTGPSDDLCKPSVTQGFLGAENQAIRVQLTATNRFIWGYDNASPLYRVQVTWTSPCSPKSPCQTSWIGNYQSQDKPSSGPD